MKKTSILLAICCLLALASCQKKNAPLFRGDYSFKTSGSVTARSTYTTNHKEFNIALKNEIGQLQIAKLDQSKDSVVVVMNYMNGDVIVTHACCNGRDITFKNFKHNLLDFSVDGNLDLRCEVNVAAKGTMYDDNTLILNMIYDGEAVMGPITYDLYGNDIRMVATRN